MIAGRVKAEPCKTFPDPAPNVTDVEQSIKQMQRNDPALTALNLNNIQVGSSVFSLYVVLWLDTVTDSSCCYNSSKQSLVFLCLSPELF